MQDTMADAQETCLLFDNHLDNESSNVGCQMLKRSQGKEQEAARFL